MRTVINKLGLSPKLLMVAIGVFFSASIVGLFLVDLKVRYDNAIADAKRDTVNYAEILAEYTALSVDRVDRALSEVQQVRQNARSGAYATAEAANLALRQLARTSPFIVAVGWTDASGNLQAHSYNTEPPRPNISDMAHFVAQRDGKDAGLFVAPPYRSVATNKWFTAASRRIENPDGSFAGVVTAAIDQSYFNRFYRSVKLGDGGSIVLMHRAGKILAREPVVDSALGKSFADGPLLTEYLPKSDFGSYETVSMIDGVSRIGGYKAVPGLPLVVLVTHSRDDVLAPWYRHLYIFGSFVFLVILARLIGTIVLVRKTSDLSAKTALLEQSSSALEQTNLRFEAALSNMQQGLCLFDGEKRLVIANSQFREMYNLPEELVRSGTELAAILQHHADQGVTSDRTVDEHVQTMPDLEQQTFALPDGRVIEIRRKSISDGGWIATHEDITERAQNERKIAFLAQHDLLTGLANRALFTEKLDEVSKRHKRHGHGFTVLMLDLDKFKAVNDTLGHPAGDQLLVEVAQRLRSSVRDTDVLARLGGDEFAIIQEGDPNQHEGAIALALRIVEVLNQPFDLSGHQANIGTSIGIAFAPDHGIEPGELLKRADLALYDAKTSGRNDFRIFQPEMIGASETRKTVEAELREAISSNAFELHYQPVVDARTRLPCGVEALARWRHPTKGLLTPDQFISLAESTGLIVPLGGWILQQACKDAVSLPEHLKMAVNISAVQLDKGNLLDVVLCTLVEIGLSPQRLELEITEAALLHNQAAHLSMIRQLRNLGISIVLDDFGTGHSSPNYLLDFPFDKIKIDKPFAQGAPSRRECAAVVSSILALAHGLDVVVSAEAVETEEQFEHLRSVGIDLVQGDLFGKPVPIAEFGSAPSLIRSAVGT